MCPDSDLSPEGDDHVEYRGGMKNTYGNTYDIDFRRSILPKDKYDAPIPFSGDTQVGEGRFYFISQLESYINMFLML